MRRIWKRIWVTLVACAVCAAIASVAAGAFAAGSVVKGGSYKGALLSPSSILVSFKVSSDGRKVRLLAISNIPIYCSGGGRPIPVHFKDVSISRGSFTSSARYIIKVGPLKGQVGEKLKITGKFGKGGREQGILTTVYPKAAKCGGKSAYATKA